MGRAKPNDYLRAAIMTDDDYGLHDISIDPMVIGPQEARNLAAWLISAADYLDHVRERK